MAQKNSWPDHRWWAITCTTIWEESIWMIKWQRSTELTYITDDPVYCWWRQCSGVCSMRTSLSKPRQRQHKARRLYSTLCLRWRGSHATCWHFQSTYRYQTLPISWRQCKSLGQCGSEHHPETTAAVTRTNTCIVWREKMLHFTPANTNNQKMEIHVSSCWKPFSAAPNARCILSICQNATCWKDCHLMKVFGR